jgi:hypothetical protein
MYIVMCDSTQTVERSYVHLMCNSTQTVEDSYVHCM